MRCFTLLRHASGRRLRTQHLPRQMFRQQHDQPHKWYFQGPDFVPPTSFPKPGPSLTGRLVRSILYATVCCTAGFAATNIFTTWTWLHTLFEPGDEADAMLMSLINERFATEPLTHILEAEGSEWVTPDGLSLDGLDNCLRGSRGVNFKYYINPKGGSMLILIHFGEGVEGHPGMVHGGCIASFVHNAMEVAATYFFPAPPEYDGSDESWDKLKTDGYWKTTKFEISFEKPVMSGDVYAIHVIPALLLGPQLMDDPRNAAVHMPKIERENFSKTMIGSLMQIDYLPSDEGQGRRFIRYGNAVGSFGNLRFPPPKKPIELSLDGKIT